MQQIVYVVKKIGNSAIALIVQPVMLDIVQPVMLDIV